MGFAKWILILLGVGVLAVVAFFLFFAFMIWNHERGYPKFILSDAAKGTCLVSQKPFVLLKVPRSTLNEDIAKILPIPDGVDYFYNDYSLGSFLAADGTEIQDLTSAIDVPTGTRFILKGGFKNRTLNDSQHFYWLEPEGLSLDSSYFYRPLPIATIDGETYFYTDEEMSNFPDNNLFRRACDR